MSDGPNDANKSQESFKIQIEKTNSDPELLTMKKAIQEIQRQQRLLEAQERSLQEKYKEAYSKKFNEWLWNVQSIDYWD